MDPVSDASQPVLENTIEIRFDPLLSSKQIVGVLEALANYYRACGGVGLTVEFETEDVAVRELECV
jgi:hypothetical protein